VKELVTHHVGGLLKIAPEHTEENTLSKMMKPGIGSYDEFKRMFERYSAEAGKKQYLIPYFIAAHPGCTDEDMLNLALWLKKNDFKLDQVQTFMPTPMAMATTMYHTRKNPLKKVTADSEGVETARSGQVRRLHKAFLRFHDPANWPILRDGLKRMGRSDLIGNGAKHLVPAWSALEGNAESAQSALTQRKHQAQEVRVKSGAKNAGAGKVGTGSAGAGKAGTGKAGNKVAGANFGKAVNAKRPQTAARGRAR
jgi:hypothetical protein